MTLHPQTDPARIRGMTAEELAAYLRRRLRLEAPLDPPLDHRFGQEPPEKIVITAWRQSDGDPVFSGRLVDAIRSNLREIVPVLDQLAHESILREQLSSLAFLARAVGARALLYEFVAIARDLWARIKGATAVLAPLRDGQPEAALVDPLYLVIDAVSELDDGAGLAEFWCDILGWSCDRGLRSIAWFGLSRANKKALLERLGDLVEDSAIRLPSVASRLARRTLGGAELGKAARRLSPELRQRLRDALAKGKADAVVLQEFDRQLFKFRRFPPDLCSLGRPPSWVNWNKSGLQQKAA